MMPLQNPEPSTRPSGPDQGERLSVSTQCPNCGAPLDFDEGIHAVECHHCKTHLLVTGRKRLQTYTVDPSVDALTASRTAQLVLGARSVPQSKLLFVPYYRFTAHDFFWYTPDTVNSAGILRETAEPPGWKALFAEQARKADVIADKAMSLSWGEQKGATAGASHAAIGLLHITEGLDLKSRLIDRTFIASVVERPALFSLGVRGSALKLRLLQSKGIDERGTIVAISVPPQAAVQRALQTYEQRVAMRATVCQSLSVIYFPYWVVGSDGDRAAIIDGVTGGVADPDLPRSVARELSAGGEAAPATIELRALTCPNCGWDFPVRPEDVAFLCSSCDRAWQLIGAELRPIEAAVADVRLPEGQAAVYLPFWVLSKQMLGENRDFFVAAFRYKNLRNLHQLASSLTGRQPEYTTGGPRRGEMIGCFYDEDDACCLSRFLEVRKRIGPGAEEKEEPAVEKAVLTWIPFGVRGSYLIDPFLGTNLYQNMLT
jgi:DNA-directed RNA polymerase subunit RPC12/RpoP